MRQINIHEVVIGIEKALNQANMKGAYNLEESRNVNALLDDLKIGVTEMAKQLQESKKEEGKDKNP